MSKIHDVVVVGAGPGGSAAAHYLAQSGLDVVLLDKADFPREKTCGDGLTPRALGVLKDMCILDEVASFAYRINGLELHGSKGNTMTTPIPEHPDYPNYAFTAPRLKLDEAILKRAIASGSKFRDNSRVRGLSQFSDHAEVLASHRGREVRFKGRVVVLAVGANLSLLYKIGILKKAPNLILAVRGYFEGVEGLSDRLQAHFSEVPLPGYGWVFPISDSSANVGIGSWNAWAPWRKPSTSTRTALDHFLAHNPRLKTMMIHAQLDGPVKGFPLRVDFARSPTCHGRILLVGESAGLVSPLTCEGIDFALESGRLAAGFLTEKFGACDLTVSSLAGYDQLLRSNFQHLFVFLSRIRRLYLNPILMDKAILATRKFPDIKELLVKVMLSQEDAASMVNLSTIRKVILGV